MESPEDALLLQMRNMIAEHERALNARAQSAGQTPQNSAGFGECPGRSAVWLPLCPCGETGGEARHEINESKPRWSARFAWIGRESSIGEVQRRLTTAWRLDPTGKSRWDRDHDLGPTEKSGYKGQAAFGKTAPGVAPRLRVSRGARRSPRRARPRRATARALAVDSGAGLD